MARRSYILIFLLLSCSAQAAIISIPLNSFNAGELSPLMEARSDFTKYNNGCRLLRNMFVLSQGPVARRPGTKYIADAEDPNVVARLIPFEFSRTDTYAMEFGHNIIRFYRNGGQILDDDDAIYELASVFEEDELPKLQFTQLADVMYIVSGTDPPQKLSRFGHSYWTIADVDYKDGPFLEEYTAPDTVEGDTEDYASDEFSSTARELSSTAGTASGAIAYTNDNDDATYRYRQGHNSRLVIGELYLAWAYFTIEIPFNSTADNIEKVIYKIGWYNNSGSTHTVSCKIHYDTADEWVEISTDTDENVEIGGDWDDVNGVKLYVYNNGTQVVKKNAYAGAYIYEIEAWGTQDADTASINYIKSSNTATYDRTLDASAAADQGGSPNIVRIPSTAHGFLEGDYITLDGTTNYDGTHPITNVNDVDTFDIASAFTSETFATTDTAVSRALIYTMEDTFAPGHIGALWEIRHPRTDATVSGLLDAAESSSAIACEGDYKLTTHGTWTATVALERSNDSGTNWEVVPASSRSSVDDDNISYAGDEPDPGYTYRVTMSDFTSGSATYTFVVYDHMHTGVVKITDYIDANDVTAEIITDLDSVNKTTYHSEGYWSDKNGWPQTIEFHEYRLWYGGSQSYPQTIWASKTIDYEEMKEGTDDDDALIYSLHGQNPIQFLHSYDYLIIGTLGGIGRMGDADEPMTPTTEPQYRQQTPYGSAFIPAISAGDAILYIGYSGDKVREFAYSLERDRFVSPDLTVLAEHIIGTGIKEVAYQITPDSVLWCVLEDGDMATMTYQRENDVFAWSLQVTDGDFESVAIIPGTDEDEVWVIVNRTIDDATARYIEQIQPRDWGSDDDDCWFVDSGLEWDGGDSVDISGATKANPCVITVTTWPTDGDGTDLADDDQVKILSVSGMTELNGNIYTVDDADSTALTFSLDNSAGSANVDSTNYTTYTSSGTVQRFEKDFSNLSHIEGETASIFADGEARTSIVVSSDAIDTTTWHNKVLIGLPYTSIVETMPLVFNTRSGSTSAEYKKIINVSFDFYETLGLSFGIDADNLTTKDFDDNFDGWKQYSFPYGQMRPATIYVETSKAIPMTIRQIIPKLEIYE